MSEKGGQGALDTVLLGDAECKFMPLATNSENLLSICICLWNMLLKWASESDENPTHGLFIPAANAQHLRFWSWKPLQTSRSFSLNLNKAWVFTFVLTGHTFERQNHLRGSALVPLEEGRPRQLMRSGSLCKGTANYSSRVTYNLPLVF